MLVNAMDSKVKMMTEKKCERCGNYFNCNAADIKHCACNTVKITGKEIEYISMHYR